MTTHQAVKVKVLANNGHLIRNVYCLTFFEGEDNIVCTGLFRNGDDNLPHLDPDGKIVFMKHQLVYWARRPVIITANTDKPQEIGTF